MIRHFDEHDRPEVRMTRADGFCRFYIERMLAEAGETEGFVLVADEARPNRGVRGGRRA